MWATSALPASPSVNTGMGGDCLCRLRLVLWNRQGPRWKALPYLSRAWLSCGEPSRKARPRKRPKMTEGERMDDLIFASEDANV